MKKDCIHSGCSNNKAQREEAGKSKLSLCKFHENEFMGKSDWICSWCEAQHEQAQNLSDAVEPNWEEEDKDLIYNEL